MCPVHRRVDDAPSHAVFGDAATLWQDQLAGVHPPSVTRASARHVRDMRMQSGYRSYRNPLP
jgi:hypothetical protein